MLHLFFAILWLLIWYPIQILVGIPLFLISVIFTAPILWYMDKFDKPWPKLFWIIGNDADGDGMHQAWYRKKVEDHGWSEFFGRYNWLVFRNPYHNIGNTLLFSAPTSNITVYPEDSDDPDIIWSERKPRKIFMFAFSRKGIVYWPGIWWQRLYVVRPYTYKERRFGWKISPSDKEAFERTGVDVRKKFTLGQIRGEIL